MSKTPNYDVKVKAILDATKPGERVCELTGEKWFMDEEEIGWYRKFNVPPSKQHPITRAKILFGFPSGLNIWWKGHFETGEPLLSCIHNESPFQILPDKDWKTRDFSRSGPELDSQRSIFEQLRTLAHATPTAALRDDGSSINTVGIDMLGNENSWMVFSCAWVKNSHYGSMSYRSDRCLDIANSYSLFDCYTVNHCAMLHNCIFSFESRECLNCSFIFDCRNCEYCFGAVNARNKKYLWFGEQLSRKDWEERRREVNISKRDDWDKYKKRFFELMKSAVWPENFNVGGQNCAGEYMLDSVNCQKCYRFENCSDNFSSLVGFEFKNAAFNAWIGWGSNAYNCCDLVNVDNVKFCFRVWYSTNLEYCLDCMNCDFCFGCVGLQRKKFHIFNIPYPEEEYWKKVDEIKSAMLERGEYGEYFPADFSAVGFQFSMGDALFDYTEGELKRFAAPLFDPRKGAMVVEGRTDVAAELTTDDIPDDLNDPSADDLVGRPIADKTLDRNFIVTAIEFDFYQRLRLPLPRQHFLTRLKHLMRFSNSPLPEAAVCGKCQKAITTYKNGIFSERKVYCHDCYLNYLEETT